MNQEQLKYLANIYKIDSIYRDSLLNTFPEIIRLLYDFAKPMKLIDLSWIKCIYGGTYEYKRDNGMWGKMHNVDYINGRCQFNWKGERFETELRFFAPNV